MSEKIKPAQLWIEISITGQYLRLYCDETLLESFIVSTARNGPGEHAGSECTPRGWHQIRAKIGAGQPENSVFVGRRPTGEVFTPKLFLEYPERDWILTRILWLSGLEAGKNRLGNIDTMRRYIYLHGTADEAGLGVANSHGCVRMRNCDIIRLFDCVPVGTRVLILE